MIVERWTSSNSNFSENRHGLVPSNGVRTTGNRKDHSCDNGDNGLIPSGEVFRTPVAPARPTGHANNHREVDKRLDYSYNRCDYEYGDRRDYGYDRRNYGDCHDYGSDRPPTSATIGATTMTATMVTVATSVTAATITTVVATTTTAALATTVLYLLVKYFVHLWSHQQ